MHGRQIPISVQDAKLLIKEVKKRGCLWDPENDQHHDKYHMAKAWNEISEELHMSEDALRGKWKNLRDLYKKECKKFGSSLEKYNGKWRHYAALSFLGKTACTKKNSVDNNETHKEQMPKHEYVELNGDEVEDNDEIESYFDSQRDPLPEKRIKLSSGEDYDLMFLKSLTPYFKQLDPIRKLVVRSKIQDMLFNELAAQTSSNKMQLKKS